MKGKQMKTTMKIALCVWAWLVFQALQSAHAFYDPGVQRWLNRDPIGDHVALQKLLKNQTRVALAIRDRGFANLYDFAYADPIGFVDTDGRSIVAIEIGMGGVIVIVVGTVACHFYPPCAHAAEQGGKAIAKAISRCIPKDKPNDREKECREMHDRCVGSGLDCFSCLNYCRHYGSWPEHLCPSPNF